MAQKLLRVVEMAEVLGLKPSTIRAWLLHRKIRYIKIGRSIRIPAEVVDELIEAGTVQPRANGLVRQGKN